MRLLGFSFSKHATQGFSLIELLICLALLGLLANWATPGLQRLQQRVLVDATRDQLMGDLQLARIKALQQGQALQMSRLSTCAWSKTSNTDWSCGWQLQTKASSVTLQTSPVQEPISVVFAKVDPLEINRRGDLGTVGERWVIKSLSANPVIAVTLCINSASRVRWQSGESCS